jgi:hypothetical protein
VSVISTKFFAFLGTKFTNFLTSQIWKCY